MENLILKKSSKVITDCFSFEKDGSTLFRVEFIDYRKTWKTYEKDWKTKDELEKYFRFIFIKLEDLPEKYQKMDNSEICQEFKGKSVIITTSIWQ